MVSMISLLTGQAQSFLSLLQSFSRFLFSENAALLPIQNLTARNHWQGTLVDRETAEGSQVGEWARTQVLRVVAI